MGDKLHNHGVTWLLIILVLTGFGAAVMYFSRNNPDLKESPRIVVTMPTRPARIYSVFYQFGIFSPTNLSIHAGDSVKFQNDGKLAIHIVSDLTNNRPQLVGFDSVGDIQPNGAFTYTFAESGIFGYHNSKHINETGTIIVKP